MTTTRSRRHFLRAGLFFLSTSALSLASCQSSEQHASAQPAAGRCAHCGMRVTASDPWHASLVTSSGETLAFDAPKCMFRLLLGERGRGARSATVTEYYSGEARPAASLHYVLGSDILSPMGRDLVPIDGLERAERFARDHRGQRVLAYGDVTSAIIDELFTPRR